MNETTPINRLKEAFARVEAGELEDVERAVREAETVGRQAVLAALATPIVPPADNKAETEADRQRLLDAALADASNVVERHRDRLGRRVMSRHDATTMRHLYEALRGMADAAGGADQDPSFQ